MSYAVANLVSLNEEVTASETDGTYIYLGTAIGDIIRYTIASGVVTTLRNIAKKIISMSIYSGVLYVGSADGTLTSITTT
jgi:hypothetical protein